jgi:hypothetical protein
MKKKFIIYGSAFFIVFFLNYSANAQQQKKPSERSFKTEMQKVKQMQSERNEMIRKAQQPSDSSSVARSRNQTANTNTSTLRQQASPAVKPSAGKMRQPKKQ